MTQALFTIIKNQRGPLSKSFALNDGVLHKTASANLVAGFATQRAVRDLRELAKIIHDLRSNQALTFGVTCYEKARLVTQEIFARGAKNAVCRDRAHFFWPKDRGIFMLDIDKPSQDSALKAREFDAMMCDLLAWWAAVARLYRPSASAFISDAETGEIYTDAGSLRCYAIIDKAENIPFLGVSIAAAFWRAGYGRIAFSESGAMMVRCPIDCAVWQPERLDFAGPVVLGTGLVKQKFGPVIIDGADIDSESALADFGKLSFCQWASNSMEVRKAKQAHRPEEKQRKRQIIDDRVAAEVANGADVKKARQKWRSALMDGVLRGDYSLYFTDGVATVNEVLASLDRYDLKRLADPVEPAYANDPRIAIFFANQGRARPHIFSHAHGGRKFVLAPQS